MPKGPHTRTVLPSVLTAQWITVQLDWGCAENTIKFVQLKYLDWVTFETAEDLTVQFTLDCSVCCVLKAEAQFVYIFTAVNIT